VGGLSHYLEDAGLATTQISLVREHTERIKPPRALWVPFDLGRPLGVPNDSEFQARVLKSALTLLNAAEGPVLEDFSEDAPFRATDGGPLACPVDFRPKEEPITELDHLLSEFKQEFDQMHNWYDLSKNQRGRTTADSSGLDPEMMAEFITRFIRGKTPALPLPEASLGTNIKMAVEDLKAYYIEAVTSQPGQPTDSTALADWFWSRTTAAQIINEVRKRCIQDDDERIKRIGGSLLIPKNQLHRFEG
jgi:hypothetical protein